VFKRELGVSPMQALSLLRLERAASMLERSSQTLARIAEQLGYSSQFHFSRRFKQLYGVAPSRYREEFRRGLTTRPGGSMFRHHRLRRYAYEAAPGRMAKPVGKSRKKSVPSRRERGGG
jgi:AraC-like DNA-binding protein